MAIEYDKNHFDSYVSLALVYAERREFNLAKTTLQSCLRINKEHEEALKVLEEIESQIKWHVT